MGVSPPTKVLIVDNEPEVCWRIENVLSRDQMSCTCVHTGSEAKEHLIRDDYDVAIIDLNMPGVRGIELLQFMSDRRLPTRALCMGAMTDAMCRSEVMAVGAVEFLEKPLDMARLAEEVLCAVNARPSHDELAVPAASDQAGQDWQRDERLRQMVLESCRALAYAVEAKDPYTRRHSEHVSFYAEQIARRAGLPSGVTETIRVAGLVHDIGKIAVPDAVLTKRGRLSEQEFALVRRHPDVGAAILGNISVLREEGELVRFHHEAWDGSGYPAGLSGEEIPLGARVINLADSIDAMLMERTYKQPRSIDEMIEQLRACAGGQFAPDMAATAVDWCQESRSRLIVPQASAAVKSG